MSDNKEKKDKKETGTITIRFNVTESEMDKEMKAILSALPVSSRVDFIKECVMSQSRRILRNEAESFKVDVMKLKEEYIKNNVNVAGVTFSTKEDTNDYSKLIELITGSINKDCGLTECLDKEDYHNKEDIDNTQVSSEENTDEETLIAKDFSESDELEDEFLDDEGGCPPEDSLDDEEF